MKTILSRIVAGAMILSGPVLAVAFVDSPGTVQTTQKPAAQSEGDRVFQQHCSRCHQAPMTLSPRTTGAVIMHMRVRARLSRKDEQLLLRFMAP
jgi:cytochrome c5